MDILFMNSENSEISDTPRILLNLTDKVNLKGSDKYVVLSNFSIYYIQKSIKKSNKNNKFKISAPRWNEEFKLLDGSYSVSDTRDCFEYIFKKHGEETDNPSITIYVNKIEHRITFKIKIVYYLKLLMHETNKLLLSIKKRTKDENGENKPHSAITEVVLLHYNIVNNDSRVLITFVPNEAVGQLLNITPTILRF